MGVEKSFENKLKNWLCSMGIYALGTPHQKMNVKPCGYYEKRWGGGRYVASGLPDMHIVLNKISLEVELKAPNGKLSELQVQKINQIKEAGCIALVLHPEQFENFKKLVAHVKCNGTCDQSILVSCGLG